MEPSGAHLILPKNFSKLAEDRSFPSAAPVRISLGSPSPRARVVSAATSASAVPASIHRGTYWGLYPAPSPEQRPPAPSVTYHVAGCGVSPGGIRPNGHQQAVPSSIARGTFFGTYSAPTLVQASPRVVMPTLEELVTGGIHEQASSGYDTPDELIPDSGAAKPARRVSQGRVVGSRVDKAEPISRNLHASADETETAVDDQDEYNRHAAYS